MRPRCGAGPSGRVQAVEDGPADVAGGVGVVGDVGGLGEPVAGGVQGGGEAGAVRVGAGTGFDRGDHGAPQRLIGGEQRPDLLLHACGVGGAQHPSLAEGVPQRQVGDLVFPAVVIQPDQRTGGIAAGVDQGGGQPVVRGVAAAVGAGHGDVGGDDAHRQRVDARQVGAVVAAGQHRRLADRADPGQELRAGAGQLGEELAGVEAAVEQHQHVPVEQTQQATRVVGLCGRRRPEHRTQQGAGPGLDQGHQFHHRVAGDAVRGAQLAQPGPVAVGVGHLDRHAAIEGHRPVPAEPHARGGRLCHRPRQRLEQRLHRGGADPAAQIPQRLVRHRHAQPSAEAGEHARPHLRRTHTREKGKGQNEIHANPGRQPPQPLLGRAGLLEHRVDQLEGYLPGQLAQVTGREHARGHGNRPDHRRHRRPQPGSRAAAAGSGPGGHDRIGHRGSFVETDLGRSRFYQEPRPFHRKFDIRVPRVTLDPTVTSLTTRDCP